MIQLYIDDSLFDINKIYVLGQRDPYPGDHFFELHLVEKNLKKKNRGLNLGEWIDIDRDLDSLTLFIIEEILADYQSDPMIGDYFLNKVTYLHVEQERLIIRGIASTIIR